LQAGFIGKSLPFRYAKAARDGGYAVGSQVAGAADEKGGAPNHEGNGAVTVEIAHHYYIPADAAGLAEMPHDVGFGREMVRHLRGDHAVEGVVGERQFGGGGGDATVAVAELERPLVDVEAGYAPCPAAFCGPRGQHPAQFAAASADVEEFHAAATFRPGQSRQVKLKRPLKSEQPVQAPKVPVKDSEFLLRSGGIVDVFRMNGSVCERVALHQ